MSRALSQWRYNLFVQTYGNAKTWPREGKSKIQEFAPPDEHGHRKMIHFDGYSYLQSVASLFCTHRKNRTCMGLTDVQLAKLRALPWMENYLKHLQIYHEKYGSRDKHPSSEQKLVMFKQLKKKPTKEDRFLIHDKDLLPSGIQEYEFDARRFMDAITYNWKLVWGIPVKRVPIELSDQCMDELIAIPWFYDFVFKMLRKHKKVKHGDNLFVSQKILGPRKTHIPADNVDEEDEAALRKATGFESDSTDHESDDGILPYAAATPPKQAVCAKRPLESRDLNFPTPVHQC